jgi:hypothetical protein
VDFLREGVRVLAQALMEMEVTQPAYWVVQFAAAGAGSLLARACFGASSGLAATMPPPGQAWPAVGFAALITG